MGAFLRRSFAFLLLAGLLYLGVMAFMARVSFQGRPLVYRTGDYYSLPGGGTWASFTEYDPHERQDAVIIGSSHAYQGYDPQVFAERGHRVYNLGSSAQSPLNTYQVIKHFLDRDNCPLLIYDIYMGVLVSDGFESTVDLVQNQSSGAVAWNLAWAQRDLRGLNMLGLRLLGRRDSSFFDYGEYQGRGYTLRRDSLKEDPGPPSGKSIPLNERQLQFLQASLDLCRERGIQVVATNHFARSDKRGRQYQLAKHRIDSLLTDAGVHFVDLGAVPGIDERNWFVDETHLNGTGARIFTDRLVDSLESLGYLPHRALVPDP